ncbi:hypothetical protein HS7_15310 [Sulfolobales archaeon HS-7]|nr:hypothetical protein HS7_15310 [Sulfolobales archaeon HS-7]
MNVQSVNALVSQYKAIYSSYTHSLYTTELIVSVLAMTFPGVILLILLFYKKSITSIYNEIWFRINRRALITEYKKQDNGVIYGIVLGLIIVASLASFGYLYSTGFQKEPFSYMLMLNEEGVVGGYPSYVLAGSNVSFLLQIGNHEGVPMLYMLTITLLNSTYNQTLLSLYRILYPEGNYTFPISISIQYPGQYKIVAKLYDFNLTSNSFKFDGVFNQFLITVK